MAMVIDCSGDCSDGGTQETENARTTTPHIATQKQCIATRTPAWQFARLSTIHYQRSRSYSAYADELLAFFALHRTATADQIQRYFAEQFGTLRSARMHLQTLATAGDLDVVRGIAGHNVYLITPRGLRSASYALSDLAPSRRPRPTGNHLQHELLITELAVLLQQTMRQTATIRIQWQERFAIPHHVCFKGLVPDYAFLTDEPRGRIVSFVEVSSGEESTTRFRRKLLAYSAWSESDEARRFLVELYAQHGAVRPHAHYRLLCVMHNRHGRHDETRLEQLLRAADELDPPMRRRIWCTTAHEIAQQTTLGARIWVRVADLEQEFKTPAKKSGANLARRLALARRSAPRHALFENLL